VVEPWITTVVAWIIGMVDGSWVITVGTVLIKWLGTDDGRLV
jgi:hypothetical protein